MSNECSIVTGEAVIRRTQLPKCRQTVVKSVRILGHASSPRDRAGPIMFGDYFRGFARPLRLAGFSYYKLIIYVQSKLCPSPADT